MRYMNLSPESAKNLQCIYQDSDSVGLCAALGLGDVSNKQNNILKHQTQSLFPVYSNEQLRSCPGNANFGLNISVMINHLQKIPTHVSTLAGLVCIEALKNFFISILQRINFKLFIVFHLGEG